MALAQATENVEQKLPLQYTKYTKVFNEPGEGELPPWRPFNHGIDLKETFIPKVAKTYPMNQKRWKHVKYLLTNISSQAKSENPNHYKPPCSSLFKRRTEDSTLARTIDISMSTQSRTLTHSPSSPPSLTN